MKFHWPARHEIVFAWHRFVAAVKSRRPTRSKIILCVLGSVALGVMAVPLSIMTDNFTVFSGLFSLEYWTDEKGAKRSEVTRNVGLMSAAVIGLVLAFWRSLIADKQRALTERGLITDRFNKAVENLSSEKITSRLGGIHALWMLIEEIPDQNSDSQSKEVQMILNILASFIRDHPANLRAASTQPLPPYPEIDENNKDALPEDMDTAVRLLANKDAPYRAIAPRYRINLSGINLSNTVLNGHDFRNITLSRANFSRATIMGGNFSATNLSRVNLSYARMYSVDFQRANLSDTNFTCSDLSISKLCGANFSDSDLTGANAMNADFADCNLMRTKLGAACFISTNFCRANFYAADLRYADLSDTDFSGSDIKQEQINTVMYSPDYPPKLPEGVDCPNAVKEYPVKLTIEKTEKSWEIHREPLQPSSTAIPPSAQN